MRALTLALALLLTACTQPRPALTPTPVPTREPGTYSVTALLDLSGSRSPNGGPQRDAMELWADQHASASPRARLKIVDVAGSPSRTLIELRRAAAEDRADAIVVGASVVYDDTFARAVELAHVPVLFTLPIVDPGGGFGFALAPTPAQLAVAALDDAAARIVLTGSIVVSDESPSAIPERTALMADLVRRSVIPTLAKAGPAESAKLRTTLATSTVVLFAGPAKPYLDAARAAPAGSLLYFSYLCDPGDMGDLRDAPGLVTWPGSRWIAAGVASAARLAFLGSYTDRAGPPTTPAASAFDALALLASAAEGGIDGAQMRRRMEATTLAGVATTYAFTPSRHAGFTMSDLALLRYTGARTAPVVR